jgi:hypothetical protein
MSTLWRKAGAMNDFNQELLKITLAAAVPLWIHQFRMLSEDDRLAIAKECGGVVAEKGDIIQFKSTKKGETAKAFNQLARGLACLAYAPGGVTFAGMHFEAI